MDGRLSKIGRELQWDYDWGEPMEPRRVVDPDGELSVTLAPRSDKHSKLDDGTLGTETHQEFGRWSGTVRTDDGIELHLTDTRVRRGSMPTLVIG